MVSLVHCISSMRPAGALNAQKKGLAGRDKRPTKPRCPTPRCLPSENGDRSQGVQRRGDKPPYTPRLTEQQSNNGQTSHPFQRDFVPHSATEDDTSMGSRLIAVFIVAVDEKPGTTEHCVTSCRLQVKNLWTKPNVVEGSNKPIRATRNRTARNKRFRVRLVDVGRSPRVTATHSRSLFSRSLVTEPEPPSCLSINPLFHHATPGLKLAP